jgi:hypothetical protein
MFLLITIINIFEVKAREKKAPQMILIPWDASNSIFISVVNHTLLANGMMGSIVIVIQRLVAHFPAKKRDWLHLL